MTEDEELELLELEEEEFQANQSAQPAAPKELGVMDMIVPSFNRPLTDKEKARSDSSPMGGRYPLVPANAFPGGNDPRLVEGALDVLNTGSRVVGAAIPSSLTRGENPDGTTKSFKQAMADSQTGLLRGIREKYEARLGENLNTMKAETNPFKKVLAGIGVGLDGIGLLAAAALEPGGGSVAKAFGRAAKVGMTGGKNVAKTMAQTYIKETGVPEAALQRLADDPKAIKAASHEVDTDWRTVVENHVQNIKNPILADLSKEERKAFEAYQERLAAILDKKAATSVEAHAELDNKLMQLDQEVRDFTENIKAAKASGAQGLKVEAAAGEGGIEADALTAKGEVVAAAPGKILGDVPRADELASGNKVQSALQDAEKGLSDRYGELKDEGFKFNEARDAVIPAARNTVRSAWQKVKDGALKKYGEGAISPKDEAAFEKLVEDHAAGYGPSTIGGLLNARKHIGAVIYGKTGIKESDELFRGMNRNIKEDFYAALNDEVGTQLNGFYRRKGVPREMADEIVAAWDGFNQQYSNIRRGLETVEKGIRFSAQGGKVERYAAGLEKMGVNDLKKAKSATLSAEATRPVWDAVKGAYLNKLVDDATVKGEFSPKKFGENWKTAIKEERDRLTVILGDEKVKELDAYYKKLGESLDEIDAASRGDLDALAKAIAEKAAGLTQKTGTASNAVSVFKKAQTKALQGNAAARKAAAAEEASIATGQAKKVKDASLEALDARKREIEAIGTIVTGKHRQALGSAMTNTNMTGPKRKQIMDELVKLYGPEEAQKIQDVYFAKAIGASGGSIPLLTRMPTGRSLFLGFVTGHPLGAAIATSPQVAASALRYGQKPAGRLGQAIEKVAASPRLVNLFKMLDGVKKAESRNRIILRIMQEMEREGIVIPEEQPRSPEGSIPTEPAAEESDEFPDDFEPDPIPDEEM